VEPESQPQILSVVAVQVVDTIRFGPEHVEQALHGDEPDNDQVEPATHAVGPPLPPLGAVQVAAVD
jgi:hypothetical protein